jgi:soluble lytic murein transglycosylase-like protein
LRLFGVCLLVGVVIASSFWVDSTVPGPEERIEVGPLVERVTDLQANFDSLESIYDSSVMYAERIVRSGQRDSVLARRIAWHVVAEAHRVEIPVEVGLAIMLVENPMFHPTVRSFMGATGLTQVMPFHAGNWKPCGPNLEDIRDNICTGFSIFRDYLDRHGAIDRALLAYNGCVRGTNTPDCHSYPRWIMERLGRVHIRNWLEM